MLRQIEARLEAPIPVTKFVCGRFFHQLTYKNIPAGIELHCDVLPAAVYAYVNCHVVDRGATRAVRGARTHLCRSIPTVLGVRTLLRALFHR